MNTSLRLLIVEDSAIDAKVLLHRLRQAGYDLRYERVQNAEQMKAALHKFPWDVIISDYYLPHFSAPEALAILKESRLDIPFIILSGTISEDGAVGVLKAGAHDYIPKGNAVRLIPAIQRELHEAEERRQRKQAEESLRETEAKLRELVELSIDGLYIIQEGRWTYVNSRLAEIFGYTAEEIMRDKTMLDLIAPVSRPLVTENIRKRLEGEVQSICYTMKGLRKDGEIIDIEAHGRAAQFEGKPAVIGTLLDITERTRAEEALRESEERYRELFENANDIVYTHDLRGNFTSINKAGERITGHTLQEAMQLNIAQLVAPECVEEARRQVSRKVAGEAAWTTYELEITHKDGHRVPVEVSSRLVFQRGRPVGVQGICRDITERKRAENDIRQITAFLDSIIENIPIMLFVKDAQDLRFERFNKAGEELLGYRRADLIGKNDYDFFPKELADAFTAADKDVLHSKRLLDVPEEIIQTTNGERILHTKKIPILGADGLPRHLLGISEDITERKRAEEERDRFFTLSVDMLCIAGFDGYFKRLNPSWHKTLGYTDEELLSKPCLAFIHPEDHERTRIVVKKMIAGEDTIAFENRYRCTDGSYKWLLWNSTPYPEQGLIYGVAHDVTARKQAQQKLEKRSKQLQQLTYELQEIAASERQAHHELKQAQSHLVQSEKLTALGQMVAGVAHEINNPLSFVGNNVAVLQRDVKAVRDLLQLYQEAEGTLAQHCPDLVGRIKAFAERIDLPYTLSNLEELMVRSRDGLKRIQQIVNDLRDFARLDESDLHEVDLNTGIESTINIVRGRAKRQGVALEVALGKLPNITCFPAKVNQVVLNLVVNALDACAPGGKVILRTCPADDCIEIHVEDTGQGIDPLIRDKIFDPFFTTKPPGEGTGLGLSISYGIVQDHGGEIDFDSAPGRGTHFVVRLPFKPPMVATGTGR